MAALAAAMPIVLAAALAPTAASPSAPEAGYARELKGAARTRQLAETREWRRLLHYRPGHFGGWRSEADGLGFFLAGAKGQRDPVAELDATIDALLAPTPNGDDHAQC